MAANHRVYDSCHLQAHCQEPESASEPYARQSSMGYLFLPFTETVTAAEVPQSGSEWVEPSPLEGQKLHE